MSASVSIQFVALALMICVVIRIAWIDWHTLRIPDPLTICVALLACVHQVLANSADLVAHMAGTIATMAVMSALRQAYMKARGQIGLGLGDIKFAGAAVLWINPWNIPVFFLISATTGLMYSIIFRRTGLPDHNARIPFGPFLGFALVAVLCAQTLSLLPVSAWGME